MLKFEWHDKKEKANRRKHKILFEDAKHAFTTILEESFNSTVDDEDRWQIIGLSRTGLPILVIFTLRNDIIRIISVRRLIKSEREKL